MYTSIGKLRSFEVPGQLTEGCQKNEADTVKPHSLYGTNLLRVQEKEGIPTGKLVSKNSPSQVQTGKDH